MAGGWNEWRATCRGAQVKEPFFRITLPRGKLHTNIRLCRVRSQASRAETRHTANVRQIGAAPGFLQNRMNILLRSALAFAAILFAADPGMADWITWDRASDRVVSHTDKAAAYPRARRLSNGDILLGYH